MIKVFIVDDEMPARAEIRYLLEQYDEVEVVGEAASGEEALELIPKTETDVVFLDIHLHDRDGLEVAEKLVRECQKPPFVVFASAYDVHAVRAFETEAVDYILKPFRTERLEKSIQRVKKRCEQGEGHAPDTKTMEERLAAMLQDMIGQQPRRIPVEKNGKILLLDPKEIVYATVEGRNAVIYTKTDRLETSFTLQELEQRLPGNQFCRTHRAYIANLFMAEELIPWFKGSVHLIMQDEKRSEIPVSRTVVKEVKKRLGF